MSDKPKLSLNDDGEIEFVELDAWPDRKLKRGASPWERLARSPLLLVFVLLQTFCLGMVCVLGGLTVVGVIQVDRLRCQLPGNCESSTAIAVLPTLALPAEALPCDRPFLADPGSTVGFVSDRQYSYGAGYVLNLTSGALCRFLANLEGVYSFAWSPDGQHVVFNSSRGLWLADGEGQGQKLLTGDVKTEDPPDWSPDGKTILFTSHQEQISQINMDGSGQVRLTDTGLKAHSARWSPDGRQLVFVAGRDAQAELYVMDADGKNQRRLTNNTVRDDSPAWLLDGKQIAFMSERDGNPELYLMPIEGGTVVRLTNHALRDDFPAAAGNENSLLFVSYNDGNNEIFLLNLADSSSRRLTSNRAEDTRPVWRPGVK